MFKGIGRRLLGALSVTGRFKTAEAQVISDTLEDVERDMRTRSAEFSKTLAAPYGEQPERPLNRGERSAKRRRGRHRVSRNKAFHAKRNNPYDSKDGITFAQPYLTQQNVGNKGVHFIYNPLLQKLLWANGHMDASHGKPEVLA